ncbi:MAG: CocE/NonD family hydrolase [Candidatus Obscuribacterales bacterium]|nr:CocE/NonD family hydrolase [Candidatus Obscuribacterales bacterium]
MTLPKIFFARAYMVWLLLNLVAFFGLWGSTASVQAVASRLMLAPKADQSKGIPSQYKPERRFKHFRHFSLFVTMKDGTKIATEVYLPSPLPPHSTLPVMFEQSRYWRVIDFKFPLNKLYPKTLSLFRDQFLSQGYAWVVTDTRGGGASTGARPWEFCPLDTADSKEIMQWILKQPWSDGNIGVIGHSYSGNLAELSLLSNMPNIKAAAIISSPFDLYCDDLRPGGMPLQPFISDWGALTHSFDNNRLPASIKFAGPFLRGIRPVDGADGPQALKLILTLRKQNSDLNLLDRIRFKDDYILGCVEKQSPAFVECIELLKKQHGSDYKKLGVELSSPSGYWKDVDAAKVPIYAGAGWIEGANANAAINRFNNYSTPGSKLIIGPWDHNMFNISPFTRGGPTRFKIDAELLKFFDYYLKGLHNALPNDGPVNYYTLGEEKWHSASSFPPGVAKQKLYLGEHHVLSADSCATAGGDRYIADKTVGSGKSSRWDCMLGKVLLQPYPDRQKADKKLLVYQTAPLKADTTVTGSPRCNFYLDANGSDCALFAYLEDVTENGKVHYVTEGELMCGNRVATAEKMSYKSMLPMQTFKQIDYRPLSANELTEVAVGMLPASYQFKKGHRVRLSVGSADKDHFKLPQMFGLSTEFTLHRGSAAASFIELPIDEAH